MSAENALTEEDRQLLQTIDQDIDQANDGSDFEKIARDLRDKFAQQRAEMRAFKHEVDQRLTALEEGTQTSEDVQDGPVLLNYANIPQDEREEVLSTSEQIAVTIHCNWSDIAWKMGDADNRKIGVDTKTKANAKYNPSKLRHRLKQSLGWDPQSVEIYRGLKRLAKLSGGEEGVNESDNRVQVFGGMYEYREMTTADYQDVKRVLWRSDD